MRATSLLLLNISYLVILSFLVLPSDRSYNGFGYRDNRHNVKRLAIINIEISVSKSKLTF